MHDALCQAADEIFENQRDMINTRVRYESDDEGQGDINSKTTQRSGDKMKEPSSNSNTVPPVDDFAIGMVDNATSIRYMSEWGGTLHDVDGYTSDESADEAAITGIPKNGIDLDDSYFEARRQDFSSGDEESSQSDMESVQDDQGSEDIQEDEDKDEEEEEEEEEEEDDEDTFMEVRTGSQPIDVDSGPSSMQMAEDVFHEDAGNSGDEEEMEEVM
ncbi:hypothetical protein BX616_005481 [Lobosporangium transversale]|nr:hypothetical protein BX616_005481 [Lobosporangium transversale]